MKKNYLPEYPFAVCKYCDWTKTWKIQHLFMFWSDAEEWMEKNCPEGVIVLRF